MQTTVTSIKTIDIVTIPYDQIQPSLEQWAQLLV